MISSQVQCAGVLLPTCHISFIDNVDLPNQAVTLNGTCRLLPSLDQGTTSKYL